MHRLFAIALAILMPTLAMGETPFELQFDNVEITLPSVEPVEIGMAPPSTVQTTDGDFFIYINSAESGLSANCNSNPGNASCLSLANWTERTLTSLLNYTPFQLYVQNWLESSVPATMPVFNEALSLPLVGEINVAMYLDDLWNNNGCGSVLSGPTRLETPSSRIGCKFGDDDTRAVDLINEVFSPGQYSINIYTTGAANTAGLASTEDHEGTLCVDLWLNRVDVDAIFHQPTRATELLPAGVYMHAAGKVRLSNLNITGCGWSTGGNLRSNPNTVGYGIGLHFQRLYVAGTLDFDVDGFDCSFNNWCNASILPVTHPDYNKQAQYSSRTTDVNSLTADFIKYLESDIVYEAQRASGAVTSYLTALELIDLSTLTHTPVTGGLSKPTFEHPYGSTVTWDYGLFYRWNSGVDESINIFGGFDVDFQYNAPCQIGVPGTQASRVPVLAYPPLNEPNFRNGRQAMVGMAIHRNAFNRILDEMWSKGVLCLRLTPDDPTFGSVLNTNSFGGFLPTLKDLYRDRPMMVEFRPLYVSPGKALTTYVQGVDQPMFLFGNLVTTSVKNPSITYPFDWQIKMPHVEIVFYIDIGTLYPTWVPLFGVETSIDMFLGFGWYKLTPSGAYWNSSFNGRGCDDVNAPCRVFRLSGHINPEVIQITSYNLPTYVNNGTITDAISNLLAMLLDGLVEGYGEVGLNLVPLFGMTIDPTLSYAEANTLYLGTVFEPLDVDANGVYEYYSLYLRPSDLYGGWTSVGTHTTGADGYADTIYPGTLFEEFQEADILGAPKLAPQTFIQVDLLSGTKLRMEGVTTALDLEFYTYEPVDRFMYTVDSGVWRVSSGLTRIGKMFPGQHEILVQGVGKDGTLFEPALLLVEVPEEEKPQMLVTDVVSGCGTGGPHDFWMGIILVSIFIAYVAINRNL